MEAARSTSAPTWDLAAGRVPKWSSRVFERFCEKHDISQARLIREMREHGYPTMNAQQLIRWRSQKPRQVTIVALYNALEAVAAALRQAKAS